MLKKVLVALVGTAMGGLVGLGAALLGAGSVAIVAGAVLGGLLFSIGVPWLGRSV
jgi:hypothetical protein